MLKSLNRKRKAPSGEAAPSEKKEFRSKHKSIKKDEKKVKSVESQDSGAVEQRKKKKSSSSATAPTTDDVAPEANNAYNNNRTVYLQGLPFKSNEAEVRKFFKDTGEIVSIRLPKWHDSGNLKGYGHVEFRKAEDAAKALEKSGEYIQDRYVTIDRPMTPRVLQQAEAVENKTQEQVEKPPGCKTVHIKNLPYELTEDELKTAFMVYGPIVNIRLPVWQHTNNLKGFGYVEYKREDSAEIAVKKSGTLLIKDRRCMVDYETGGAKTGFLRGEKKKAKNSKIVFGK